jgi:glutaredoxin
VQLRTIRIIVLCTAAALVVVSCRRREEAKPPPQPDHSADPIAFDKNASLVFIYADVAGKFHQAPSTAAVLVDLPRMPADGVMLEEHDDVIIYGTSWCGACKQAKEFLAGRRIPYIEKDVERDPRAAAELAAKAAQAGISADRVPIIDVRGRILVGFDAARLATLLGERL